MTTNNVFQDNSEWKQICRLQQRDLVKETLCTINFGLRGEDYT